MATRVSFDTDCYFRRVSGFRQNGFGQNRFFVTTGFWPNGIWQNGFRQNHFLHRPDSGRMHFVKMDLDRITFCTNRIQAEWI
jgi:hypothetical protein